MLWKSGCTKLIGLINISVMNPSPGPGKYCLYEKKRLGTASLHSLPTHAGLVNAAD